MALWIPITIFAAFMQNARSALQKALKGRLTEVGAAYVRFLYALPWAIAYLFALKWILGVEWPEITGTFLLWCLAGGVSQILFTWLLLVLFNFHNFAVGTTFSKTEVVQVALLGLIFLGDRVGLWGGLAIALSAIGVLLLSASASKVTLRRLLVGLGERATLLGLTCGLFLGASVVFFRGATLAVENTPFLMAAAFALAIALIMQTIIMGAYILYAERETMGAVLENWRPATWVGITGMLASVGWFTAFTLQNAAYVRALGQIELLFTFLVSVFWFKERSSRQEVFGILLVVAGIILLLLAR